MSEKFSSGTKNYKQTNKQNSYIEIAAKAQLVKRFPPGLSNPAHNRP